MLNYEKKTLEEGRREQLDLDFQIKYGLHRTAEDFVGLEKSLAEADIYIPEAAGWSEDQLAIFQKVSSHELNPVAIKAKPPISQELKAIYKFRKPVFFADIPKDHELLKKKREADMELDAAVDFFRQGDFWNAVRWIKDFALVQGELERERENYMMSQLKQKLPELLESYPELKKRVEKGEKLRMLMTLGPVHTGVYHGLKKEGYEVKRGFHEMPYVFPGLFEIVRQSRFNKKVNNEAAARALISSFILGCLLSLTNHSYKAIKATRKITSRLSLDDIRGISENMGKGCNLIGEIEKRGIKFPHVL